MSAPHHPMLSVSIQGQGGPPPPPSDVRAHVPLISHLLPQQVDPLLQPSAVNSPPIPQLLAFTLQQYVPPLQPLAACDPPPLLSVLLPGRGEPPLLTSTVHAYVPLIYALIIWQCLPLRQPSANPAPLPHLSALPLQRGVPPLHSLAVCDPPPPPLSVLLQGLGVPHLLHSTVHDYAPLIW